MGVETEKEQGRAVDGGFGSGGDPKEEEDSRLAARRRMDGTLLLKFRVRVYL